jgi:hypothetical protein
MLCRASTAILSLLLASACAREIAFQLPSSEPLQLSIYRAGAHVEQCILQPGSSVFSQLQSLLDASTGGWERAHATFVSRVVVSGSDWSLNFLGQGMILNYTQGQYVRKVEPSTYAFLSCANGT